MYNKSIFKRCFSYKGKYWFYNTKEIPTYIKQMRFLMKHGYDMYACWETFDWFIHTIRKILTHQRYYRHGSPVTVDGLNEYIPDEEKQKALTEQNEKNWNQILDTMFALLDEMDEENPEYENLDYHQQQTKMNTSKDIFFKLFSQYFYYLWD
ncbi:MAG: hypothetical protein IJV39_01420 [Ruminococcus sp.]|nr:hypothetical protein [Ruminococcus sp.]